MTPRYEQLAAYMREHNGYLSTRGPKLAKPQPPRKMEQQPLPGINPAARYWLNKVIDRFIYIERERVREERNERMGRKRPTGSFGRLEELGLKKTTYGRWESPDYVLEEVRGDLDYPWHLTRQGKPGAEPERFPSLPAVIEELERRNPKVMTAGGFKLRPGDGPL